MNVIIYLGTFLIIVGILCVIKGTESELNNRFKIQKGRMVVTVNEGVLLTRYTLENCSFDDGTGPVYVVGYKEPPNKKDKE